jgi:hypothetical protein
MNPGRSAGIHNQSGTLETETKVSRRTLLSLDFVVVRNKLLCDCGKGMFNHE